MFENATIQVEGYITDSGATKKPASIPRRGKQGSALIDAMIDVAAEQSVMDPQPDKNDNPEPPVARHDTFVEPQILLFIVNFR